MYKDLLDLKLVLLSVLTSGQYKIRLKKKKEDIFIADFMEIV